MMQPYASSHVFCSHSSGVRLPDSAVFFWINIFCKSTDLARFLACPFMAADRTNHTDCTDPTPEHGHNGHNLEVDFRATPSTRSLTWQVPESLVRGIPFRCLLAGGGRPFRTKSDSAKTLAKQLKPCVTYDAFISHDWQTSGWLTYASLLLLFNSQTAAIVTLVVSVAGGLLIFYELLPNSDWAICIGYLTFIVLLLFWQNIRDVSWS